MSIKDLIIGDRIRIQEVNGVEITVQIKNVYRLVQSSLDIDRWVADVEAIDGRTWTIDDSYDFYSMPNETKPAEKTLNDKVERPSHYHSDKGIDLIEFCRQQFTEEEFRGAMKFTQMRYALRTGRKEDDVQDQKKLGEYANRFIGALENDN
ncbi:DUF3310 domain-containing protein [Staphylococcus epidermidis]|uniref:DUF3310 domain-containing protein n=1 Tax=Staphylococcus epidermidis TaxID=1282 RepID=UPI001F18F517|nr:DUF3310 domain-containing protein [Staphylococcus epidermidis]MCE5031829.1 DUF3310 domain-containing protein [Staphylococcus epidermidis]MCE5045809.1 DUF3310 domain-containing protein [Staphylococcus epidermidis]